MPKPAPQSADPKTQNPIGFGEWAVNAAIQTALWLLHRLPYRLRVPFGGWVFANIVTPLAGYRRRIGENLDHVMPDLPATERRRLMRAVPNNIGRTVTELYSPTEFRAVALDAPISGPGLEAIKQAQAEGRPSMLVSGHFGNYDVIRASLLHKGFRIGGLYRPMNNRPFNDHYVATISTIGTPLFERGRRGMADMIRFLRGGGTLAILIDQHMRAGAPLTFFGKTAWTALSTAEMALKYDAVVIPCYAVRRADGIHFDVRLEAPVPHTTAEEMTQALNDSLEAIVRENMDQWFWIHRRWKAPPKHMTTSDEDDDLL